MPGVGKALRREIAGLVLVGRLMLWGFGLWAWHGADLAARLNGRCCARRGVGLTSILTVCVVFSRSH